MKNIIESSQNALNFLSKLINENGEIILYLSGGCCDGSALLCYQKDDFKLGSNDILLGSINENIRIYTHKSHFSYLQNTHFYLDIESGNGSEYSLEYGENKYFVLKTETCEVKNY